MNSGFKYFCTLIFVFVFLLNLPEGNIYAQELKLSNLERDTLLSVARQYLKDVKYCALITIDSTGYSHARTMDPFQPDKKWIVWLATNPKSRKVNEIRNNQKVTLYYTGNKGVGYVSITGTATIVNEQSKKDSLWKEEWSRFYKNRSEDYLLIKVVPKRLEILNYKKGIVNNKETWRTPYVIF